MQNMVASKLGVKMLPKNSIVVEGLATRAVKGLPIERRIVDIVTVRGRPLRKNIGHFIDFLAEFKW